MYAGRATHPCFAALRLDRATHGIPRQPFADLVDAFVQDQTVTRYRNWDELLPHCRDRNPVGTAGAVPVRLPRRRAAALSDATCTRAATRAISGRM